METCSGSNQCSQHRMQLDNWRHMWQDCCHPLHQCKMFLNHSASDSHQHKVQTCQDRLGKPSHNSQEIHLGNQMEDLGMVVVSVMGKGSYTPRHMLRNHLQGTLPGTPSDHRHCIHMCMMLDLDVGQARVLAQVLAQGVEGQDLAQVWEPEILPGTTSLHNYLRNFLVTHCSNHPDPILCKFHNHQNN